ncbi:MAG: CPBP family intramembrane metalloprotease, partial [Bacteroidales bacterium]|nr:CPBP family intramembrane metalloprotease [Bacteroidales bacterium]
LFNFIPRFIMGILLGYIFYFTKSIWASILVHFMNNASVVVMTVFMGVEEMNNPMEYPSVIIEVVIITLTLMAGLAVMYYGKKYLKVRTENNAVE